MTEAFTAHDAATWMTGHILRGDPETRFESVTIDSRRIEPGALFFAIVGERFDGHEFLSDVVRSGAAGCVISAGRQAPAEAGLVIEVRDTTPALGHLAAGHRQRFPGVVVAITGSNGKTTTKEMCAAILGESGPCLANEGNLNNQFGLPLTLLRREASHHSLVVELGMNHRGEIQPLAAIARPKVGVITNVGTAHIEHLGSREAIAQEKGDLVAALDRDGVAVLNADDPLVLAQAKRTNARVIRFGEAPGADVRAESVRADDDGRFRFQIVTPSGRAPVAVSGLGETTVVNSLAAAAGALAAGATLDEVVAGLDRYWPVSGRLEPIPLPGGGLLINDTYNANPQSMGVALRTLARGANVGRRLAVLGDMGELGDFGSRAHKEAGALAAHLGVDRLIALGEHAGEVVRGARDAGMDAEAATATEGWEEAAQRVLAEMGATDRVLVKGSRSMRMERIVEHLRRGVEERS